MCAPAEQAQEVAQLQATVADLRRRLGEAEDALDAISSGEVDALVVSTPEGERVLTLSGTEHPYRTILEAMSEGACTFTGAGTILYANSRLAELLGTPLENIIGVRLDRWLVEADRASVWAMAADAAKRVAQVRLAGASGPLPVLASVDELRVDGHTVHCMVATDITERLTAEQALLEREEDLLEAQALAHVGSWSYDPAAQKPDWSLEMFRIWGLDPEAGAPSYDQHRQYVHPDDWKRFDRAVARAVERGEPYELELRIRRPDGTERTVITLCRPQTDDAGRVVRLHGTNQDVTERKQALLALQESEAMRDVAETVAGVGSWRWERGTRALRVSPGMHGLFDSEPGDLERGAVPVALARVHPDDREALERAMSTFDKTGAAPEPTEYRVVHRDGRELVLHTESRLEHDPLGVPVALVGYNQDVTGQRRLEAKLAAAANEWRETFDAMSDSVAVLDGEGNVTRCNAATTAFAKLDFDEIIGRACHDVVHRGLLPEDCPRRRALATGRAESNISRQDGRWLRVTFVPQVDDAGRVGGGVHVVSDVTALKQAEEGLLHAVSRQEAITDGVIVALAAVVESRDPYTSGHQERVSRLAAAIAWELGLDELTVRGVEVGGRLHDLGKASIPVEILSKPGRLSQMEFELIKDHCRAGYDILHAIDFPWPVAEIALQHQERLDGSGYPASLRDGQILLEARILAVADVVEAMSSDRPYRPALGMEVALAEIRENAGVKYDAEVSAACLRLVEEQGFTFAD